MRTIKQDLMGSLEDVERPWIRRPAACLLAIPVLIFVFVGAIYVGICLAIEFVKDLW